MHKVTIEANGDGMVQVDVFEGPELEFRAMRRGGIREGIRMVETFVTEGPEGFVPKLRGASYMEIAQALVRVPHGERFTSHKVTDLVHEEGVHDRSLVLKNVSSALTKLRKRSVPYLVAAGKQGKSVLYELGEEPSVASVVGDLQD
ncbi:MAG: hypothetical protein KY455_05570 [Euryarchaeota archaeon]|nr:hypothetical protein [Euryarchaeota archaeon]